MMQKPHSFILSLLATSLIAFTGNTQAQSQGATMTAHVETMPAEGEPETIDGAEATLRTSAEGAMMTLTTGGLNPGHVTTAWWVMINNPKACESSPCGPGDVLERTDTVKAEITYADGMVVDEDGWAHFASYMKKGEVEGGWYGHAFVDPTSAEIHLVLNDHGPLIPELAVSMLTTYRGGCTDESLPPPFPDSAKAQGTPGPNDCMLVQDAIFQQ